jgi:hypothetical protein
MIGTSRSRRAAHRADRMDAKKTGERTGVKAEAAGGGGAQRQP